MVLFVEFMVIWVRWMWPRFRYDQLMDLGWRRFLPLALANISIAGLDPLSLQGLNVRHVSLDANTLDLRPEATANYVHFAQMARIANVHIMVSHVMDASALSHLRQFARLGSGPAFAAPRRVRRTATQLPVGLAA